MNAETKLILEKFSYSPELTAKFNATWNKIKKTQAETLAIRQKRLADTRKEVTSKQRQSGIFGTNKAKQGVS